MGLQIAYHALNIAVLILLCVIGYKGINSTFGTTPKAKIKKLLLVIFLLIWQVYIFALGQTDILQNYDLPPRFVIFHILPAFTFTGIFAYSNRNSEWLGKIPKSWLIFYQTFRIAIETLFVFTVAAGILHPNVTIEGYNYDMVFAFTAPLVGFLFIKKILSEKILIIWNYLGLAVIASIIFIFLTTIFVPEIYGNETNLMPMEFTEYPFSLIAGFLMPSAAFIHVLSIVQLSKGQNH